MVPTLLAEMLRAASPLAIRVVARAARPRVEPRSQPLSGEWNVAFPFDLLVAIGQDTVGRSQVRHPRLPRRPFVLRPSLDEIVEVVALPVRVRVGIRTIGATENLREDGKIVRDLEFISCVLVREQVVEIVEPTPRNRR